MTNTQRHKSVWDAIEETRGAAENVRIHSALMQELTGYIEVSGMIQAQAARLLGVTQPRISDLTRGRIDLFSIDGLVNMLTAAGLHLDLRVRKAG